MQVYKISVLALEDIIAQTDKHALSSMDLRSSRR
jgi:hypothetical protein